jgi:nucleotide-binding universal stress UspA family protein
MWTYPPHRILVAADFGEASDRAIQIAGALARVFKASLTALHSESFEAPPYFTSEQVEGIERQRKAARREAGRYLEKHAAPLAGMPVDAEISDAPPAAAILDASHKHDLIVMGTHGRRGPARWWAGSVAERVARESRAPVLIVRADSAPPEELFKRIAVIARGGTFDGGARRYAKGLAQAFGGECSRETASSLRAAHAEEASLVVIAQATDAAMLAGAVDRDVRACRRPLLLVPSV